MAIQNVVYEREKLYAEVWKEPATVVAKRYSVSSNALAKVCKRLRVPAPTRGYWRRRAVGTVDPTPALPPLEPGGETKLKVARKGRRPDRERIAESRYEGRAAMGPPIVVPDRLGRPHPLVEASLTLLVAAKVDNGLVSSRHERCLDIAVSPTLLARAARIMNTLLLALEERGIPVEVTDVLPAELDHDGCSNVTRAYVSGEWIRFGIVERLRQFQPPSTSKPPRGLRGAELEFWRFWNRPRITLVPSGRLVLVMKERDVGVQVSWFDGARRIEERLNDFVKQLFVVADSKQQTREADGSWRHTFEVESERTRQARERAAHQARRVATVRDALARWREAGDLRCLINELRRAGRQDAWLDWAEGYAGELEHSVRGIADSPVFGST